MKKTNKILTIVTVLLVSIFIAISISKKLGYSFAVKMARSASVKSLNLEGLQKEEGLSASNREWLRMVESLPKGVLSKLIVTTTVKGKVVEISDEQGKLEGYEDYYTGEKGYYVYYGRIKLLSSDALRRNFYFSQRRMNIINVYEVTSRGSIEKTFKDIKEGDRIEMEESVDLTVSNIDDKNVLSLTIRIFR